MESNNGEQLKRRLCDIAERAYSRNAYTYSRFLSPMEQSVCNSLRNTFPVSCRLYGGNDACIRKIAVFGSTDEFGYDFEDPVRVIRISPLSERFSHEMTHRDYLGALMRLGIDRGLTGDIIVKGKEAWVFVLETSVGFITGELTSVGRDRVRCEEITKDIPDLTPQFRNITANIASERLDLIVSASCGISRDSAQKLIKDDRVFINERTAASPGHKINRGDTIVIRGFGKFIYDGITGTTRKNRLNAVIRKYV